VSYSLAAETLGMRFVYLEAGSGAKEPIPPTMISAVKKNLSIPLIIGGGIRTPESAFKAKKSGADIVVTGTLVEEEEKVNEIINEIVRIITK
jgi:phosphoglycerol geranylgeranyltransferase